MFCLVLVFMLTSVLAIHATTNVKAFLIAEFVDLAELAVVPRSWIISCQNERSCPIAFPKVTSNKRLATLTKSQSSVKASWPRYCAKIIPQEDKYKACEQEMILEDYDCDSTIDDNIDIHKSDSGMIEEAKEKEEGSDERATEPDCSEQEESQTELVATELLHAEHEEVIAPNKSETNVETMSLCCEPPMKRARKQYSRWPLGIEKHLREFCREVIEDFSTCSNKGTLPSNTEKREFLSHHPGFLSDQPSPEKLKIVHAKLLNERAKARKRYFERMESYAE